MTWNAEGILSNGRELALLSLLNDNDIDVGIITETEIPTSSHGDFNVEGYHTFLPVNHSDKLKTAKYRVMVVVRSELAALTKIRPDLMHPAVQSIWIQIDLGNRVLVGGLYREWSDLPQEYAASNRVKDQMEAAAAEVDNVIFAGDINLDAARGTDKKYGRRCLLLAHDSAIAEANMRYLMTGVTYRSHGRHEREDGEARAHESILDHVYVTRDLEATVAVLTDSTTDHFPVVAAVKINQVTPTLKIMKRRNFKALERPALLQALEAWPWSDVYGIRDPDKVLDFVTRGIVNGLDQAAPVKSITVREGSLPVYLRPDTLALMAKRDSLGRGPRYRAVRNRVTALVRRDKEASNLAKLVESGNSPAVLWEIANAAVGKPRQPLPTSVTRADGTQTEGNLETADTINGYYVQKVLRIRAGRGVQNTSRKTSTTSRDGDGRGKNNFAFGFASAGRIAKVFSGLKSTSALGTDGIPVSVLKMGSDMLAGPVSHLVNMSLSAGVFPSAFKTALIHPVYKGGGKARNDPGSYRPVAILCALSKVLETVAKEDLEAYMKERNILPTSQHGFRKGRSCTTALATAHAAWVTGKARGKVVAVVGFDLSAAFDTVGREDLLPKMEAMGIGGRNLNWFRSYLTDARQRVVWDGQVSGTVDVEYGVRQGSLLGPVLYLLHVSDLPLALEIRDSDGDSGYADDTAVWVVAEDHDEAQQELQRLVLVVVAYMRANGLALNGAKTQVMVGGKGKPPPTFSINVDGAEVKPGGTFDLLGVTFDRNFTVKPYINSLARESRFRAGRVARLAQHLPRGQLLRQLGSGLLMGKLAHCLPVVVRPRLPGSTVASPEALSQVQVAVNDVARSVVGCKREDHVAIVDLLEAAKYLSLNQQAVKATAMSAWLAYHSCDGTNGIRNPVGEAMFSGAELPTARSSRSATAGEVRVRTRGLDTHVTHGLEAWNACRELRDSRTKAEACRAATRLARDSPL
jgi:hypothetical protein